MVDPLTDDQTRAVFADLRGALLHDLQPPGTASAHRTVRRRRVATVSTTAAVVAGLVAAAGVWMSVAIPGDEKLAPLAATSATATASPSVSEEQQREQRARQILEDDLARATNDPRSQLAERALKALPHQPGPTYGGGVGWIIASSGENITSSSEYLRLGRPSCQEPCGIPAGTYVVEFACAGRGTAHVDLYSAPATLPSWPASPGTDAVGADASCDPIRPVTLTITVPADRNLWIRVVGDKAAANQSRFAYSLRS